MRFLLTIVFVAACATTTEIIPIAYDLVDDPAHREFRVSFRNSTNSQLCLTPDHWPNVTGTINQASDRVAVVIGDQRFPIEDFNTGYCVGGCPFRVQPGEVLSATIPYSQFDIPPSLEGSDKRLEFAPQAFRC
jgi:hypothetical protein